MWKNLKFNKQNIEHETLKAILIKMPNNSEYKGYKFWHPSKLVRTMNKGNGYWLTFGYTDEFVFKLFKGKNNQIIKHISAEEMEVAFDPQQDYLETSESYLEVEEPKKIDEEVGVDESLKR